MEGHGKAVKNIATVQRPLDTEGSDHVGDCLRDWKELSGYAALLRSKIKKCWATRSVVAERCVPQPDVRRSLGTLRPETGHSADFTK